MAAVRATLRIVVVSTLVSILTVGLLLFVALANPREFHPAAIPSLAMTLRGAFGVALVFGGTAGVLGGLLAAALLTHRPSLRLQGLLLRGAVTGVLIGAVTGAFFPTLLRDTIILRYSIVGSVVGGLAGTTVAATLSVLKDRHWLLKGAAF